MCTRKKTRRGDVFFPSIPLSSENTILCTGDLIRTEYYRDDDEHRVLISIYFNIEHTSDGLQKKNVDDTSN